MALIKNDSDEVKVFVGVQNGMTETTYVQAHDEAHVPDWIVAQMAASDLAKVSVTVTPPDEVPDANIEHTRAGKRK